MKESLLKSFCVFAECRCVLVWFFFLSLKTYIFHLCFKSIIVCPATDTAYLYPCLYCLSTVLTGSWYPVQKMAVYAFGSSEKSSSCQMNQFQQVCLGCGWKQHLENERTLFRCTKAWRLFKTRQCHVFNHWDRCGRGTREDIGHPSHLKSDLRI